MAEGYWEDQAVTYVADVVQPLSIPAFNWGEIGGALVCLGVILAIAVEVKRWVKQKGYRMVVKDRNDKIHALLLEILGDGILQAEIDEKISRQEADKIFTDLAKNHGFRDLVPKKRLQRVIKNELRAARAKREIAKANGANKRPVIPGGPPTPIVREKFSERLGKSASKFLARG